MEERRKKVFVPLLMYLVFVYVASANFEHSSFTFRVRIRKISYVYYIVWIY